MEEQTIWDELVNKIEAKESERYIDLRSTIVPFVKRLIEELNDDDTGALIAECKHKLERGPQEDSKNWSQVYTAAAILLYYLAHGGSDRKEGGLIGSESEDALWKAAESWGVESFSRLGGQSDDDGKYKKHKHCLDSIISALGALYQDNPKTRVDRFFDSKISEYWKAFYLDSKNIWNNVEPDEYWDLLEPDDMFDRRENKIFYYELLAYRLENYQTEFYQEQQKQKDAWGILRDRADDIPKDKPLRKKIYTGLTIYLKNQYNPGEEVKVLNDIFDILDHDAASFMRADGNQESEQAVERLLSAPPVLETTWDKDNGDLHEISRVRLAAIGHSEEGGELIDNLIEFGSEDDLKEVLEKCADWIARDENSTLVERAAQKIKMIPAAVQALIYELSNGSDDKLKVQRWITKLLSEMSDPRFYQEKGKDSDSDLDRGKNQDDENLYENIKKNLEIYAIEPLSKLLAKEEDIDIRDIAFLIVMRYSNSSE